MTYLEADKVQLGSVLEAIKPLQRAKKVVVPAGTQGEVQDKEYIAREGLISFLVKWNVRGEIVHLRVNARDARFVAGPVCA